MSGSVAELASGTGGVTSGTVKEELDAGVGHPAGLAVGCGR